MTSDHPGREASATPNILAAAREQLEEVAIDRPSRRLAARFSNKGAQAVRAIMAAARHVFVEQGHAGFTLRRVAARAGLTSGNLSYYFPSRRSLLDAMLREALADYAQALLDRLDGAAEDPLEVLLDTIDFYVADGRQAHRFFMQMWGFAASDEDALAVVRDLYQIIGRYVASLIRFANPALDEAAVRRAALHIFSLEEGSKLFYGLNAGSGVAFETMEADVREMARRIVADGAPAAAI